MEAIEWEAGKLKEMAVMGQHIGPCSLATAIAIVGPLVEVVKEGLPAGCYPIDKSLEGDLSPLAAGFALVKNGLAHRLGGLLGSGSRLILA